MAHRIQELLDGQGYHADTFAKKVGVPQSTLAEILSGKCDFNNVGVSKIIAIAQLNEDGQRRLIDIANDMVSSGNYR